MLLAQESQGLLRACDEFLAVGVHVLHEQGHDIIECGGEEQLVALLQVAYHEENVQHAAGKRLVRVIVNHLLGIGDGLLPDILQRAGKHGVIETVESNEVAYLVVHVALSRAVRNLDDRAFVAPALHINVSQCSKVVEHHHHQAELIGDKGIIVYKVILILEGVERKRQGELVVDGQMLLFIEVVQGVLAIVVLVEQTLLSDVFRLAAFQRHAHLEAPHNAAVIIVRVVNLHVRHQHGEVLLGSTCQPGLVVASVAKPRDNLLQLEQELPVVADKLAYLVHQEEDAVVRIVLGSDVFLQFPAENSRADVLLVFLDGFLYGICSDGGYQLFGNLQQVVKECYGEAGSLFAPVEPFVGKALLEGIELSVLVEHFFKMLRHCEVLAVVTAELVELIPEYLREHLALLRIGVVYRAYVEKHHVDGGLANPGGKDVEVGRRHLTL